MAGFGLAIGEAARFEQQMDHFAAVSNASGSELKQVSDLALEMGRTTVFSANEAAGAMVELGKAGFDAKEILAGIGPAVVSLASAGDLPLTRATEILVNTLRTFNLEAKDSVYVADQLAGAANASTIEVDDMATSLRYAGAVASSLGIPLSDVADALAILGNNGIRGSNAGTTLRRVLLELNPATKQQADTLRDLGIIQGGANLSATQLAASDEKLSKANDGVAKAQQKVNDLMADFAASGAPKTALEATNRAQALRDAQDALADAQENATRQAAAHNLALSDQKNLFFDDQGNAKSLGEIFQILQDRTKNLNAAEKQRVLDLIFGSRAVSGALILAKEGAQGFADIAEQINQVTAADVAAKRLDNLSGAVRRLKNTIETNLIGAGTPLQDFLQGIVEGITKVVTAFGGLPAPIQTAAIVAGLLFGVLAIGAGTLLLAISTVARAVRAFSELRAMFVATNVAKVALDRNVPILAGRLTFLTRVVELLLSPFKLLWGLFVAAVEAIAGFLGISVGLLVVIIAIIAIFVVLLVKVKAFREFFINLGKAILDWVQKVPGAFESAARAVGRFFERIGSDIAGAAEAVGRFFGSFPGAIEAAARAVGRFFERIGSDIAGAAEAVGRFFVGLPGLIGGWLSTALGYVGDFAAGVGRFLASLPGIAIGFLGQMLSAVVDFMVQLPNRIAYGIGFIIGLWLRFWIDLFKAEYNGIVQLVQAFVGFFVALFNLAVEWVPKIFNAIVTWFEQLPGRIVGFLDVAWETFSSWAERMWNRAFQLGSDVLSAIVTWFEQLPGVILSFLDQVFTDVSNWTTNTWNAVWQFGSDVLSAIVNWFSQLPGVIAGFLSDAYNDITNWATNTWNATWELGSNVLSAIVNWFSQLPGTVEGLLSDVFNAVTNWATNMWNSAVDLGRNFYNGLIDSISDLPSVVGGILDRVIDAFLSVIGRAWDAAKSLASSLWNGFKSGLGINSPSYIEEAAFAMVKNVGASIKELKNQVGTIQGLAMDIANPTSVNFNSPAAFATLKDQLQALTVQAAGIGGQAQTVFNNEFHTDADAKEISEQIMWDQRVRVR